MMGNQSKTMITLAFLECFLSIKFMLGLDLLCSQISPIEHKLCEKLKQANRLPFRFCNMASNLVGTEPSAFPTI